MLTSPERRPVWTVNPYRTESILWNINIFLLKLSYLNIMVTQVVESILHGRHVTVNNQYHCCSWAGNATLQWRHNECDGVWNHRPLDCLLKRLFRRRPKKTSKLCVTGLSREGNPLVAGGLYLMMSSWRKNDLVAMVLTQFSRHIPVLAPEGWCMNAEVLIDSSFFQLGVPVNKNRNWCIWRLGTKHATAVTKLKTRSVKHGCVIDVRGSTKTRLCHWCSWIHKNTAVSLMFVDPQKHGCVIDVRGSTKTRR